MTDTHGDKPRASSTPRTDAAMADYRLETSLSGGRDQAYREAARERWLEHIWPDEHRELERELRGKQAVIDRLMIEYCPDEMTPEQIEEWKRHQVAAGPEATAKLDAAAERLRTRSAGTRIGDDALMRQKLCSAIDLLEQTTDYRHAARVVLVEALALMGTPQSASERINALEEAARVVDFAAEAAQAWPERGPILRRCAKAIRDLKKATDSVPDSRGSRG